MDEGIRSESVDGEYLRREEMLNSMNDEKLRKLASLQDKIIEKFQIQLKTVSDISSELLELQKKRENVIKSLIEEKMRMKKLKVESLRVICELEEKLAGMDESIVGKENPNGHVALESLERIQENVFKITESCLESDNLTVSTENSAILASMVDIEVAELIDSGVIAENQSDIIEKQARHIEKMLPIEISIKYQS